MRGRAAFIALCLLVTGDLGWANTNSDTLGRNSDAVVYIEVRDANGGIIDHGTGFVVSHDGYIITAAHLDGLLGANGFSNDGRKYFAVVGARNGVTFPLERRAIDQANDTMLLQLPATGVCRHAVTLSDTAVNALDSIIAIGFPGTDTMTPVRANIENTASQLGFYKADGALPAGFNGAPVFNERGQVIGLVEGGVEVGAAENDIVPIAPAVALLQQRGVAFGRGSPIPFASSCYAICRNPANGIESWGKLEPWGPVDSGWLDGGHNRTDECNKLAAATLAGRPETTIEFAPGDSGKWETSQRDFFGHVSYKYFCAGKMRSQPLYVEARAEACGLR